MTTNDWSILGAGAAFGAGIAGVIALILVGRLYDWMWSRAWVEASALLFGRSRPVAHVAVPELTVAPVNPVNVLDTPAGITAAFPGVDSVVTCVDTAETVDISQNNNPVNVDRVETSHRVNTQPGLLATVAAYGQRWQERSQGKAPWVKRNVGNRYRPQHSQVAGGVR